MEVYCWLTILVQLAARYVVLGAFPNHGKIVGYKNSTECRKDARYRVVDGSRVMDDLTGLQHDILYVIAGAHRTSGQDLKAEVETYYNTEINNGRLYPNLDTLITRRLVEKGELDRRTNYYAITDTAVEPIQQRRKW